MLDRSENLRPQKSHSNFFSLVWVIMCVFSDREIAPQISHCSILKRFLSGGMGVPSSGLYLGERGLRPRRDDGGG